MNAAGTEPDIFGSLPAVFGFEPLPLNLNCPVWI